MSIRTRQLRPPSYRRLLASPSIASTFAVSATATYGNVEPIVDPELTSRMLDERLYCAMALDDVISSSLLQIIDEVIGAGFFVERSEMSDDTDPLTDICSAWWNSSAAQGVLGPLSSEIAHGILSSGWVPVRIAWDQSWKIGGSTYYSPIQGKACYPWEYGVSKAPDPDLGERLVIPRFVGGTTVAYGDPLQYIPMSYGNSHPYGRSVLRGTIIGLWLTKRTLDRLLGPVGIRSAGILTASAKPTSPTTGVNFSENVQADLQQFTDDLETGWGLTYLEHLELSALKVQDTSAFISFVTYLSRRIRQAILLQNLTQEVGTESSSGSLAASKTHAEILHGRKCDLARWMERNLSKILRRFVLLNFEVDESEIPVVRSRMLDTIDSEAATAFLSWGGKMPGRVLASKLNLPHAYEDGEDDTLTGGKPASGVSGLFTNDADRAALRSQAAARQHQRARIATALDRGSEEVEPLLSELAASHEGEEQPSLSELIEARRAAHLSANPEGTDRPKVRPR